ncbi:OmpA family protein [Sediminicola luteus]|uniref:Flagellar motor protein MotB n=1 Tax=Sediminicola luteus TaxID=319238 RepID=A0A2A4G4D8_9FLAO|nr:OmpA family protein [Sediminicola luteus]PCE63527.1 flagellar motor protein MotB [Sediminicola luteus]
MRQLVLAILCMVGLGQLGFSQERLLEKADKDYKEFSFKPAIDIYEKVWEKGYVSPDLLKKLGNAYYFNANYSQAAKAYGELVQKYPDKVGPEYHFKYGQTLKSLGKSEMAREQFELFAKGTDDDLRAVLMEKDTANDTSGPRFKLGKFEHNSEYSDFAPSFYNGHLVFASDRDTGNFSRYRHTWNQRDFLDLYEVTTDSAQIQHVVKLAGDVNTRLHESTTAFSKDGQTLYFTRNNFKEGKYKRDEEGFIRLKIFKASHTEEGWQNIAELRFNGDRYSVAHPTLSPDGKFMYFASDMPGGFGQSDIYKIEIREDGSFGRFENLGDKINTEGRETFPFMAADSTLYFASDARGGLGGLDIYEVPADLSKAPQNLGAPINSAQDDFTFIINSEKGVGYFASNRNGNTETDDIFMFSDRGRPCQRPISGTVRDKISGEVLSGATVKVIDGNNQEVSSTITDAAGNYKVEIDCNKVNFIRALMQGYVPSEEYLEASNEKPGIVDFYLERETVTAGYGDDLAKLLQLSTIYFDLNKYDVRPDAEIEIQKVIAAMEKYPSLNITVKSHTDSRGRDAYNLWLSQMRAESTVDYMVSKGIARIRLEGIGFGETQLINDCGNGANCPEDEHELNRRSEFIIKE